MNPELMTNIAATSRIKELEAELAACKRKLAEAEARESTIWAVAMGAAANLESASYCMSNDPDAQKAAIGAAEHVRQMCKTKEAGSDEAITALLAAERERCAVVADRADDHFVADKIREMK